MIQRHSLIILMLLPFQAVHLAIRQCIRQTEVLKSPYSAVEACIERIESDGRRMHDCTLGCLQRDSDSIRLLVSEDQFGALHSSSKQVTSSFSWLSKAWRHLHVPAVPVRSRLPASRWEGV